MTILQGVLQDVGSFSEFVEAFDVSAQEVLEAQEPGYRADLLESVKERGGDAIPDGIQTTSSGFLKTLLSEESLHETIGTVLDAREQEYVHLAEDGAHTIISISGASGSNASASPCKEATETDSEPVFVADFGALPDEVLHYVDDQLADRLATDGSEVMAEARALGQVEIEGSQVEFHDFPIRSLVHEVAREKVDDIELEVLAGERDDYTESEVEEFYGVLERELGEDL